MCQCPSGERILLRRSDPDVTAWQRQVIVHEVEHAGSYEYATGVSVDLRGEASTARLGRRDLNGEAALRKSALRAYRSLGGGLASGPSGGGVLREKSTLRTNIRRGLCASSQCVLRIPLTDAYGLKDGKYRSS